MKIIYFINKYSPLVDTTLMLSSTHSFYFDPSATSLSINDTVSMWTYDTEVVRVPSVRIAYVPILWSSVVQVPISDPAM